MDKFLLIIITALLISCSSLKEYKVDCLQAVPLELKQFINEQEKFSFERPILMTILKNEANFKFSGVDTTRLKKEGIINTLSIEHYSLKEGQTFDEFYKEIQNKDEKAKERIRPVFRDNLIEATIAGRPSKISTLGIKAGDRVYTARNYYLQESERILVVMLGTTDTNYEDVFCQYYPVVKSVKGL